MIGRRETGYWLPRERFSPTTQSGSWGVIMPMSALENITDLPLGATVVGWRFTDWDIRLNNAAKRGPVCAYVVPIRKRLIFNTKHMEGTEVHEEYIRKFIK